MMYVTMTTGIVDSFGVKTMTDHTDAVWDLAMHPSLPILLSASSDGTVRMWDIDKFGSIGCVTMPSPPTCVKYFNEINAVVGYVHGVLNNDV